MAYHYQCDNGKIGLEEGFFFKARPFQIAVGARLFDCFFRKGTAGKVVYALEEGGRLIEELGHPYYTPDRAPDDEAQGSVLRTVYVALVRLGIAKDKTWVQAFHDVPVTFVVTQK